MTTLEGKVRMFPLVLFSCFLIIDSATGDTQNIFLNSYENCGNKMYEVSPTKDYFIRPDITGDTKTSSFRDCEVTFNSNKKDGQICLLQTGNVGRITDPNAHLEARDGLGDNDDDLIDSLDTYPNQWELREYCSKKTSYITLYLREKHKGKGADIEDVHIEFRVVDIESDKRELFLDGNYCDNNYLLRNSKITLWNRPQLTGMSNTDARMTSECGIQFRKHETTKNSSICFGYVPTQDIICNENWKFDASLADFEPEKLIEYRLKCNESRAKEPHVWCAKPEDPYVTVIFQRADNIRYNSSVEPPKMFHYFIRDYYGTEAEFLSEIKAMLASSSDSDGFPIKWIIYTLVAVVALFVLIAIGVWCTRRARYKPVENGETSRAV